eukprot:COSAG06_NODE_250_length_19080_cov_6.483029_8_plen_60_part_00
MFGKWHLGMFQTKYTPIARGFDEHMVRGNFLIVFSLSCLVLSARGFDEHMVRGNVLIAT